MEFVLLLGKQKRTQAMKSGSFRHAKLEEEVYFRTSNIFLLSFLILLQLKVNIENCISA